ncbi:amino acid adenylation domain-containing protein [Streptomyces rimosus]|uniref:amino acid adenylation domain-containing protein n=1 Tax=Streptomyces rimosus TaxID=1927 RepID=UPI00067C2B83|nr:amino acid adenylation domain-containing protein [Streptomyces rimosus]
MSSDTARVPDTDHVPDTVRAWNDTATDYPRDATVPQLFTEQAHRHPERPALEWPGGRWTYRQLYSRVRRAAAHLRSRGVRDGDTVAVLLRRSPEAVVAVLAVLEAGGAYLPLDPGDPDDRLETVLTGAGVRHTVTAPGPAPEPVGRHCAQVTTDALTTHPPPDDDERWAPRRRATDPAYVIYTSGSTGTPKGVVCPHRGPVRLVKNTDYLQLVPEDRLLATTALTFDISCWELFGTLLNGSCLVLPDPDALLTAEALERTLREQRISVLWLSAGLFHQHAEDRPGMFGGLRGLIAGGDVLNPSAVRAVLRHGRPEFMINGYGPTEASSLLTTHRVRDLPPHAESVPIGRPIANATAYVVREDGSLAVPGEDGELWAGGDGVACGYLGDPERTAEVFVPDRFGPDPDARLYRTGDMARRRRDGVLEFRGRRDRQVKIRGYRVELDEIELSLAAHPEVREAAVDVLGDGADQRLAAAVVPAPGGHPEELPRRLAAHARDRLPHYMIPTQIAAVDEIPLKSSGKIDRDRLLDLLAPRDRGTDDHGAAPRGAAEETVAGIWKHLLGTDQIRRDDDFFALGGTSLRATQVVTAVRDRLDLPADTRRTLIRHLLDGPALADFAARAEALRDGAHDEAPVDFAAEARPDTRLRFDAPPAGDPTAPASVLLTGGTGFLGVHLIDQLVAAGIQHVYCLTRADDPDAAHARIAARMRHYGLDPSCCESRIVPVPGTLDAPRFGLDEDRWKELAHTTELIVHAGARVNFVYPYGALARTNVGGTRTVLELAAAHRTKPVHHVSTVAVHTGSAASGVRHIDEDTPPAHPERISLGYPETKWVAERLVARAAARGLPTAVHRPYEITGTRQRGVWNTDTMMCALFRTIAETGTAPDIPLPLNFVPVDHTAQAIVHILTHETPDGRAYHLTNPRPAELRLLVERLRAMGYPVDSVPYDDWTARLRDLTARHSDHPMVPYLPMFTETAGESHMPHVRLQCTDTFPALDRAHTADALDRLGSDCPPVDATLIDRYLHHFLDSRFLAPPP